LPQVQRWVLKVRLRKAFRLLERPVRFQAQPVDLVLDQT
jgi:hypothetical protein